MHRLLILLLVAASCRSTPEPEPEPNPEPSATVAPDRGTAVPDAAPTSEPAPASAPLTLDEKVIVADGFEATWTNRNHKHGKGFTTGIWQVELSDGGAVEEHEFRSDSDLWAEGMSFDYVWMIQGSYEELEIMIAPRAFEPLTEDQARAKLVERFKTNGLAECPSSASSTDSGVLSMSCRIGEDVVARGRIGLFTQNIRALMPNREQPEVD